MPVSRSTASFLFRYGVAVGSICLAIYARLLLDPVLGIQFPFATLFFAVLLTAWCGGLYPALFAVILGALGANYFLMPPRGSFALEGLEHQAGLILFMGTGVGIAWIGGAMHNALKGARRGAEALRVVNESLEARIQAGTRDLLQANDSLRASETKFRSYTEHAPVAVLVADREGRFVDSNVAASRMLGYNPAQLLKMSVWDIHPEEDRELVLRDFQRLHRQGSLEGEYRLQRQGGNRILVALRAVQLDGHSIAYCTDITERKKAEVELREIGERMRFALRWSKTGAWELDLVDHTATRTLEHDRIFGYETLLPEWTYQTFLDHVVPEERAEVDRLFGAALAAQSDWSFECRIRRADGAVRWIWATGTHQRVGDGPVRRMAGIVQDITERMQGEGALRQSEERLRLAQQAAHIGSFEWNIQTGVNCWTPELEALYGLRPGEFGSTQQSWELLVHPDDREQAVRCVETALETGSPVEGEWRVVWPDGSTHWIAGRFQRFLDEAGRLLRLTGVNLDVTARKRAEEALQRANADLAQMVHQLTEANRELKARTQENEAFVYSVSHDLRAPLVNLQGFSKELTRAAQELRTHLADCELPQGFRDRELDILDGPMAKAIRFIQTAVSRLSNIIDALLRLSRAGRVTYQRQRVDVRAVVGRVVDSLRGTSERRGASIRIEELPPALSDAAAVEQIFANLIGNALNYLDEGRPGRIEVGCAADAPGGLRTYHVRDNGMGITEAGKVKLFQPFQRLHPQAAPGEGMGLAIVQRVVERLGGRIWFESTAGQGTTFFVALPALGEVGVALTPHCSPALERSQRP